MLEHRAGPWLLKMVDFGLAAVIMASPWLLGGRHPLGELAIVSLSVVVAAAWTLRQFLLRDETAWTLTRAEVLLIAGAVLVLLQIVPLPQGILDLLSPHTRQALPLWFAPADQATGLGTWDLISLTPSETRAGLAIYLAYVLLFVVTVQRVEKVSDVERLLKWLAISAALMAAFGIVQYLLSNGKFAWIYQHPSRETHDAVKGMFVNKNHFAHLLALGLGPLVWLVQRSLAARGSRERGTFDGARRAGTHRQLILLGQILALGVTLFAALMTLSRGGAAALGVAAIVCGGLMYRASLVSRRFALSIVGVLLLIGASLAVHGYERVSTRLHDFTTGSIHTLDQHGLRRQLWAADARGFGDHFRLGSGLGSHRDVYPMYFSAPADVEFTHAECGYLQTALELGLPGLMLLLAGVGLCGYWCIAGLRTWPSTRVFVCLAAVSASLAASAVHSLVDFVWYIPSLMAITTLLAACAFRLYRLACDEEQRPSAQTWFVPRGVMAVACASVILLGTWMVQNLFCAAMAAPHWERYLRHVWAANESEKKPADDTLLAELQAAANWTPDDARAHLRTAVVALQRFDTCQKTAANSMALNQIRDAALASQFPSRASLDEWLTRAVGEHRHYLDTALRHTRLAAAQGPLLGEAYVYLAELCFLEGAAPGFKSACIAQAMAVRPHSGKVLFAAGTEAALAGDLAKAIEYWKRTFHSGWEERDQLLDTLVASGVPPAFVLENFQPDLVGLRATYAKYKATPRREDLKLLLVRYIQAAEAVALPLRGPEAATAWLEVNELLLEYGDRAQAIERCRRALACDEARYDIHAMYATQLLSVGKYQEAQEHLEWCLLRKPDDADVREKRELAVKQRLQESAAAVQPAGGAIRR